MMHFESIIVESQMRFEINNNFDCNDPTESFSEVELEKKKMLVPFILVIILPKMENYTSLLRFSCNLLGVRAWG